MHKFEILRHQACKKLLHLTIGCGVLTGCDYGWAFGTVNLFSSFTRGLYTLDNGQRTIFSAFESGSFNDVFSKMEVSGTATVTRFLKAPQEVDIDEVRKYIDSVYPELPVETRQLLAGRMAKTLKADAILQARMNEPAIGDDLIVMPAQERKRLHTNFFEYQAAIVDEHQNLVKPTAYAQFQKEANDRELEFYELIECQYCADSTSALAKIQEHLKSHPDVDRLLKSPVEVSRPTDSAIARFTRATQSAAQSMDRYLSGLYSSQP